jgi:hypothetical protein
MSARRVLPVLATVVVGAITSGCDAIGAIFNAGIMLVVAGIRRCSVGCNEGRKVSAGEARIAPLGRIRADAGCTFHKRSMEQIGRLQVQVIL